MITNYYPSHNLARRATVPISPLAPTPSLIDPNLEQFTIGAVQHQQLSRNPSQLNMQNQMQTQMQSQMSNNGHLQSPMQSNNVQQLQSPMQNSAHFQGTNNMRTSQSITPERTLPARQINDQAMDDAYVQFIMYCNPSIPLDADSAELRRGTSSRIELLNEFAVFHKMIPQNCPLGRCFGDFVENVVFMSIRLLERVGIADSETSRVSCAAQERRQNFQYLHFVHINCKA